MAEIHCLTLDIFYYYLKKGFGIAEDEVDHFEAYWQGWQHSHNSQKNPIEFSVQELQGKLWHDQKSFEDSDFFFLDCSLVNPQDLARRTDPPAAIKQLKAKLRLPFPKEISLGYTQMIYGWVDDHDDSLPATLYQELVGYSWKYKREGKILGTRVVEAWISAHEWDVPEAGTHVLIILYPNEETYEKANQLIFNGWTPLLLYRHKIWYSYQKSRLNKEKARSIFNAAIKDLGYNKYNLTELGDALERNLHSLTNYSTDLNTISTHQHSLETNLYDYTFALQQFKNIANNDCKINHLWSNDLKFLEKFSTIAEVKYQKQLERDYTTLAPGLTVLEGLTATIRGLVEVQQAEIDRQQNNIIAIAGLGLATSSAFAGIAATQVYQPNNDGKEIIPWVSSDTARIHWIQGLGFSLIPVAITLAIWLYSKKKR